MFIRRILVLLPIVVAVLLGCGSRKPEKKPLAMDPEFSLNVMPVPDFWPRDKFDWPEDEEARRIRKEAWGTHGTPDFIRFVYTFDNRIVRSLELAEGMVLSGARPKPAQEWIYIADGKTVRFEGRKVHEEKLTDDVKTVCTYGDPMAIKEFDMGDYVQTSFYYYNVGKEFVFVDRRLTDTRMFAIAPGAENMRE